MPQGLIGLGDDFASSAQGMGSTAVSLEGNRRVEGQMAKGAEKTQQINSAIGGAGIGAQVALASGGAAGAGAAGAGAAAAGAATAGAAGAAGGVASGATAGAPLGPGGIVAGAFIGALAGLAGAKLF